MITERAQKAFDSLVEHMSASQDALREFDGLLAALLLTVGDLAKCEAWLADAPHKSECQVRIGRIMGHYAECSCGLAELQKLGKSEEPRSVSLTRGIPMQLPRQHQSQRIFGKVVQKEKEQ